MVNVLNFDEKGHLMPYDIVITSFETLHSTFVFNEQRERLFENYLAFIDELHNLELGAFSQWIDGSFITRKTLPNDIDCITFVNHDVIKFRKSRLDALMERYRYKYIDCKYFASLPTDHRLFSTFKWTLDECFELYGTNRQGIKKGFIQLNFNSK
jgi:hypothetical protein